MGDRDNITLSSGDLEKIMSNLLEKKFQEQRQQITSDIKQQVSAEVKSQLSPHAKRLDDLFAQHTRLQEKVDSLSNEKQQKLSPTPVTMTEPPTSIPTAQHDAASQPQTLYLTPSNVKAIEHAKNTLTFSPISSSFVY